MSKDTKGTVVIDPCKRVTEWDGRPVVRRWAPTPAQVREWEQNSQQGEPPQGVVAPESEQMTIGGLLLSLLRTFQPEKAEHKFLAGHIGQLLARAQSQKKLYKAGAGSLPTLQQVVTDYRDGKLGFQPPTPGQPLPPPDTCLCVQLAQAVGLTSGFEEGSEGEIVDSDEGESADGEPAAE